VYIFKIAFDIMVIAMVGTESDLSFDLCIKDLGSNDSMSSQHLLAHPRMDLQISPLDILSLLMLFITCPKESYEPFSWNETADVD